MFRKQSHSLEWARSTVNKVYIKCIERLLGYPESPQMNCRNVSDFQHVLTLVLIFHFSLRQGAGCNPCFSQPTGSLFLNNRILKRAADSQKTIYLENYYVRKKNKLPFPIWNLIRGDNSLLTDALCSLWILMWDSNWSVFPCFISHCLGKSFSCSMAS